MNRDFLHNIDFNKIIQQAEQSNIQHEYKPFQQAVSKWCNDNGVEEVERIKLSNDFYKLPKNEQDAAIIEALKKNYPDCIDEKIFHFPNQWFYFITDKNKFFSLRSKARPITERENDELNSLRERIFTIRNDKFFQKGKDNYENAMSLYKSGLKDVANMVFQFDKYNGILTAHKEAREELEQFVEELEKKTRNEKYFTLAPHELTRQIKIYLNQSQQSVFNRLGYKIYEMTSTETVKNWNNEFMNYDFNEIEVKHYYIQLDNKVFISACKNNELLEVGKLRDENGVETELKKGRNKGCNNDYLKHEIDLFCIETGETLHFNSQNDLCLHFNIAKSNLSRKLKKVKSGDLIKFNKVKYCIKMNDK